jgi:hypothetical protein
MGWLEDQAAAQKKKFQQIKDKKNRDQQALKYSLQEQKRAKDFAKKGDLKSALTLDKISKNRMRERIKLKKK